MTRHLPLQVVLPSLVAIVATLLLVAVFAVRVNQPRFHVSRVSSVEVAPGRPHLLPAEFRDGDVYDCTADWSCLLIQLTPYNVEKAK